MAPKQKWRDWRGNGAIGAMAGSKASDRGVAEGAFAYRVGCRQRVVLTFAASRNQVFKALRDGKVVAPDQMLPDRDAVNPVFPMFSIIFVAFLPGRLPPAEQSADPVRL